MSPEQAKGREADKRSDIWAFACVLYEMLTGRRAFDGDDMTEVLGAVVRLEPNWEALPSDVPAAGAHAAATLPGQGSPRANRRRLGSRSFILDHHAGLAVADRGLRRCRCHRDRAGIAWRGMAAAGGLIALLAGAGVWLADARRSGATFGDRA